MGFEKLTPERRKEVSSKGGKSAHAKGVAHEWDTHQAIIAGQKGGKKTAQNKEHMKAIGRLGGIACHKRKFSSQS